IINGFKSCAVYTVVTGQDESFSSITGLNDSGKSNILDAICFVLGTQNLEDLICDCAEVVVIKASVIIVLHNWEAKESPIGFEEYATISMIRNVVLGGTSKYLINGHRAHQ
ncbi:RecF/RecN/SMC, partial [Fusarium redolens]